MLRSTDGYGFLFDFSARPQGWVSFLPPQSGKPSSEKIDPNSEGWLSLREDKVRRATRGMVVEYGYGDLPPEAGVFQNQWFESEGLPGSWRLGYPEMTGFSSSFPNGTRGPAGVVRPRVFAGAEREDPSQGLLVMVDYMDQLPGQILHSYRTPAHKGPIRIVDVVGQMLVTRAEDGAMFYFDLLWRDWITGECTPRPAATRPDEQKRYEFLTPSGMAAYSHYLNGTWTVNNGTTRIEITIHYGHDSSQPRPVLQLAEYDAVGGQPIMPPRLYEPPQPANQLDIIDAICQRLTIEDERGNLLYFDVPSRRWVQPQR
ncbi:MAG: hypothetical protein ACJ78Q_11050 [Chloroflexia bacterium]